MATKLKPRLPPMPTVNDLLRLYKIHAQKKLSQNFLLDRNMCKRIVKASGTLKNCHVCEIGPGPGPITRAILEKDAEKLLVIEKDQRFKPNLEMLAEAVHGKMDIVWADILDYNMENMFDRKLRTPWNQKIPNTRLIANLPFNISTPLIIRLLRQMSEQSGVFSVGRTKMTLTFQAEVAERLFAPPGHAQRCKLSVMAQYLSIVDYKFLIPGEVFKPPPEVCAGVVNFTPLKTPLINQPFSLVDKVVKGIFIHRQKDCIKNLKLMVPFDIALEILNKAEINPQKKPFQITTEEFSRLCDAYKELSQDPHL